MEWELLEAGQKGDVAAVRAALDGGADCNCCDGVRGAATVAHTAACLSAAAAPQTVGAQRRARFAVTAACGARQHS